MSDNVLGPRARAPEVEYGRADCGARARARGPKSDGFRAEAAPLFVFSIKELGLGCSFRARFFSNGFFPFQVLSLIRSVSSVSGFFPFQVLSVSGLLFAYPVFSRFKSFFCFGLFLPCPAFFRWNYRFTECVFVFVFAREIVCAGEFVCGRCVFVLRLREGIRLRCGIRLRAMRLRLHLCPGIVFGSVHIHLRKLLAQFVFVCGCNFTPRHATRMRKKTLPFEPSGEETPSTSVDVVHDGWNSTAHGSTTDAATHHTLSRSSQHSSTGSNRGHTGHDEDSKFFNTRLGVSHKDFEKSRHLQW